MDGVQAGEFDFGAADTDRRVFSDTVDEAYDSVFARPGSGVPAFGAAATDTCIALVGGFFTPSVMFPDGSTTRYLWSFPMRDLWVKHRVSAKLWYTSNTAGTSNFALTVFGIAYPRNGGATLLAHTGTLTLPGPATAGDSIERIVTSATFGSTAVSTEDYGIYAIQALRDGAADANNNELHLLGIYLRFHRA